MRRSFFLTLPFIFIGSFALAAYLPAAGGTQSSSEDTAKQVAEEFLSQNHMEEVRFRNLFLDGLGQAHLRFDQTHAGIPILAGQIIVHVDLNSQEPLGITDARKPVAVVVKEDVARIRQLFV